MARIDATSRSVQALPIQQSTSTPQKNQGVCNSLTKLVLRILTALYNCMCCQSQKKIAPQIQYLPPPQLVNRIPDRARPWAVESTTTTAQPTVAARPLSKAEWNTKISRQYSQDLLHIPLLNLVNDQEETPLWDVDLNPLLPRIGKYGPEYPMAKTLVSIQLPKSQLAAFPDPIRAQLGLYPEEKLKLFFMIYDDAHLQRGLETTSGANTDRTRNIVYHPLAYPGTPGQDEHWSLPMGVFSANGIQTATAPSVNTPAYPRGMPFEQVTPQSVYFHAAISPDNACFEIQDPSKIAHFFSVAHLPESRACAFFALYLPNASAVTRLSEGALANRRSVQEMLTAMKALQREGFLEKEAVERVERLFAYERET